MVKSSSNVSKMYFASVLVICAILAISTHYILKRRKKMKYLERIPRPPHHPILGNLLDILHTPENLFLAERKRNREFYPIYRMGIFLGTAVNLLNPEDIEIVLTDTKQNEKSHVYSFLHVWLGTGLLTSAGSKWQNRRKILTPAFHFTILQEFIEIFKNETDKLVEELEGKCNQETDVIAPITHFTLISIGETSMGINLDDSGMDQDAYKQAIYDVGKSLTYRVSRPWLYMDLMYSLTSIGRNQKKLIQILHKFSRGVIGERKKGFTSGSYSSRKRLAMLDLLLKYRQEGAKIDDEGIREEVDTFMFEGHDTTSVAICFALLSLANHRNYQDEIYTEICEVLGDEKPTYQNLHNLQFMDRFIKECLRLYPSVPFISRISRSNIKTKTGYTIPEECMVNIHIYDMHHHPEVYPDPEKFDPDRFLPENVQKRHPFAYIPFSAGSRNCIGQKFAILEIKTVLAGILKKFIIEPVDKPEDIKFIADMVLRPKGAVKVKFISRQN